MCVMSVLEGLWGKNTDKEGVAGGRVNAQAFSLWKLKGDSSYTLINFCCNDLHFPHLLRFLPLEDWTYWQNEYMHEQIWCTHWLEEVPVWVYAFWVCKPVNCCVKIQSFVEIKYRRPVALNFSCNNHLKFPWVKCTIIVEYQLCKYMTIIHV